MTVNKLATSLFIVSKEMDALDEVLRDFETFVGAVKEAPSYIDLLDSPMIKRKEKKRLILGINGLNPIFSNFLIMLTKGYNIRLFQFVYDEFLNLARDEQKIAYVRVIVANPLNKEQLMILREELYGWLQDKELEIEVIIDKRLLGGIRIMYQGQTIDRSFYSELQELKANV